MFADCPMSHATRVTTDNGQKSRISVVVSIRRLRTDKHCSPENTWSNHVENEQQIGSKLKTYGQKNKTLNTMTQKVSLFVRFTLLDFA